MIRIGDTWENGQKLGTTVLLRVLGVWMTLGTAIAFLRMAHAAKLAGFDLSPSSGWRSYEEQAELYRQYKAGERTSVAARPGFSNHQNGRAIDNPVGGADSAESKWLNANAHRYGWKRTVLSEPWHWEYRPDEVQS